MFSTPLFLAIKLFFGGAFEFIKKNFLPVLFVVMALTIWYLYAKADGIQFDYDQHLINDKSAMSQRLLENNLKEKLHKKELNKANADAKAELEKYKLNRDREAKNLKDLYETRIDTTSRNWSERVRLEQEREATNGLSTSSDNSTRLTERERECNAAFITLEDACRITTIDYNRLRTWGNSTCDLVGCKNGALE